MGRRILLLPALAGALIAGSAVPAHSADEAASKQPEKPETFWIEGEISEAGVCRCECPVTRTPVSPDGISDEEAATLLKEFKRAQASVYKALQHRHKLEMLELRNAMNAKRRIKKREEARQLKEFLASKPGAEEKKIYEEDKKQRRELLDQIISEETEQKKGRHKMERDSLKSSQQKRLKEFEAYIERRERPPESLWPRRGY